MANEELKEQIDLKKELLNLTQKIIDVDDDSRGILLDQASLLTGAVQSEKDNNKLKKIQADLLKKANHYAKINHSVQRDSYLSLVNTVSKKMEENIITKNTAEAEKERLKRTKDMVKGLNSGAVSLLGIFGLTTGIVGLFTKFNALTRQIGEEFGAIGMQNERFKRAALETNVEAAKIGKNMKDVLSVTKSLTKEFGFSRDEALNVSNQIIDTSLALGLSSEEGTKLIGSLVQISGLSFETANNFAKQTSLLAQAEGAAPNAVIRDIAESSEMIAKFTGMTPDNLAKAAIQANKLGLTLKDIGSTAEGLLSFQDSLNKEIEASILLGRDVNLTKARQLALDNNLEGLAVEITKQVGSESEFNALNLFQRKALAESLSMSVEQLAKVVNNQNKIKTLGQAISDQPGLENIIGENAIDRIAQVVNQFQTIGAQLANSIGPTAANVAASIGSFVTFLNDAGLLIPTITGAMGLLLGKSLAVAAAQIAAGMGMQLGVGALIGMAAIPTALGILVGSVSQMGSAQDGGITTQDGVMQVHKQEAIMPIQMMGDFIADAMKPLVEETIRASKSNERALAEVGSKVDSQASRFADAVEGMA
tara:strand:- start:904 stop:2682 length:1779 start_codon:yes stop_codon:yes gene_type:complete